MPTLRNCKLTVWANDTVSSKSGYITASSQLIVFIDAHSHEVPFRILSVWIGKRCRAWCAVRRQ